MKYDLIVIGGGSGGVACARRSSALGAKVALIEADRLGGTCVIRGCVPKKLMVNAADFQDFFEDSRGFGWNIEGASFSWKTFVKNKNIEIDRLENIYYKNLENSGVKIYGSKARLLSPNSIELEDGTVCQSKIILIATGGQPFVPSFPGKEYAITSNEVFDLDKLPARMLIVGGGYIASEFAGIFNGMGVKTTQIYRGDKLLRGFDNDIREHLTVSMILPQ